MVKVENVEKNFGNNKVLKGISFTVPKGEFVVILGSSGVGKSTLVRCINGLVTPNRGRVEVNGMEVNNKNLRNIRKRVGFIFQSINVAGNLSVLTNVLTGSLGSKSPWNVFFSTEEKRRAVEAIATVGLADKIHMRVDRLSGGQKQRVGIARVLVQNPAVILADEPVSNLDPVIGREILELLRRINEKNGTVIICNLHQLEYAVEFGQRVIGISNGTIQFDKRVAELQEQDLTAIYGQGYRKTPARFSYGQNNRLLPGYSTI
jgi:phosphonate transport system ATP-binding protein